MSKWIVVVVVADESSTNKARVEHQVERADQMTAIEAVLGRQLPCAIDPADQVLIYAEPLEIDGAPEIVIDVPRPDRSGPNPYGKQKEPPTS
ncbi:MAG: hypothetical protein LAN61_10510 [Acidobacteriia bacterium]|nr:hypothetical protein [Terriglobia bacterium]